MTGNRTDVAVVGMACRYPGAASPRELWDNALAGRCAFRRIPPQRLRLEDYAGDGPDSISLREAAVLEDWQLDRVAFRVAGPSWRAADHAHWLALEVAARALEDAGRPEGEGLDREATGVLVGNSLTGEFSRAGQMRLRWPYVRRTVGAALAEAGWDEARRGDFLAALEESYKAPFPEPGEETLAGGLANTIAGRIANHFDLHGGGYTVDGACASSLLAVANACSALAAGDLEVALAGGVDLSLDPFELVGFSRTGAFARDRMRVYDARSGGFLPGEGCGMVVLVRLEDARRQGLRVHAVIRGWGLSSDGAGGLTRPKTAGQVLALERAYRRAGFGAATVGYFEGHGTGTAVGDPVELEALAEVRRRSDGTPQGPAAVGSVKAVIGHTKAAAGIAGLLKTVMALGEGVLPPTIGCDEPHPVLAGQPPMLRTLDRAEPWPGATPPRAGVSAFGFGGINAHVVLEAEARAPLAARRRGELSERVRRLDGGRQDVELLLLAAADRSLLADRAEALATRAEALSQAELSDLAAELARPAAEAGTGVRGSVVAGRPGEAAQRLRALAAALREDRPERGLLLEPKRGFAAAQPLRPPRLGFLFPGQGVPGRQDGGAWARRFPEYEAVRLLAALPEREAPGEVLGTDVAQPAIAAASLGALAVLQRLGLDAAVGIGHSLGELVALTWAGSLGGEGLLRLARARGAAMAAVPGEGGAMASLACDAAAAEDIVAGTGAVLAGLNGPRQTVVSGPVAALEAIARRARERGVPSTRLRVSHAFHSPAMEAAAPALAEALEREAPEPPSRRVMSTITGDPWSSEISPVELLVRQLTAPVRFAEALEGAGREGVDLWIEVGPGRVLGEMAVRAGSAPVASLDAGGPSLAGLLGAVGAAWVLGAPLAVEELFRDRYTRPLGTHAFLANPCESAPLDGGAEPVQGLAADGGGRPRVPRPVAEERPGRLSIAGRFGGGVAAVHESAAGAPAEGRTVAPAGAEELPGSPATAEHPMAAGGPGSGLRSGAAAAPESDGAPEDPLRDDPLALLRALVAERAELPLEAVGEEHRMLSDLHLNSIAVGQLVVEAARRVGAPPPASPTDYADASLAEIAQVLADRAGSGSAAPAAVGPPAGVDTWVRTFRRRLVAEPLVESAATPSAALLAGGFHLLAGDADGEGDDGGLATALRRELSRHLVAATLEEAGLRVVLLPEEPGPRDLDHLLQAAQAPHHAPAERSAGPTAEVSPFPPATALDPSSAPGPPSSAPPPRLVVVHRSGGAGFARSFHLERPAGEVVVVELPCGAGADEAEAPGRLAAAIAAESLAPVAAGGYREAVLDAALVRHVPRLEVVPLASAGDASAEALPLGPEDVLLVTGGGRGIAAESGLDLARRSGAALVLVGRSRPQESRELAENLERFAAAGVRYRYLHADVTDAAAVAETVAEARRELGPVTAVLHGAGRNRPRLVEALAPEDVARTLAVKVDGLAHVLAAVEPERLRLLVTFGSIIAEMGVRGEADYALANELMARQVERFAAAHPGCRCRTLEWSVWSGVGMGERLGTLESLMAQGITPIPAERGVEELAALLARPDLPTTVVVAGRFGEPPTVTLERPDLPFLRFLETSRFHVPGVELVVDAEISDASDPYLEDHVFGGERLFPAVLGLEAMAQVAAVLTGRSPEASRPVFEDVLFDRPVVVSPGQRLILRLAGLVRDRDRVEVVLRSSATGFQLDHFRAVVRPDGPGAAVRGEDEEPATAAGEAVPLDPDTDLYGGLLFHRGRFRRLASYRTLRATHSVAEIGPRAGDHGGWFARHLPPFLVLGDPGARDAVIHSVQASIPHATVLPTGIERLLAGRLDAGAAYRVEARERFRDGRDLVYDLEVLDAAGRRVERWEGLGLRAVADRPAPEAWPVALLAPHVERRLGDLVPGARPSVVLTAALEGEEDRRSASDRAVAAATAGRVATGTAAALNPVVRFRRPDGRRVTAAGSGNDVSVAHGGGLVMAVAGAVPVGCDLEPVASREPGVWRDLLGSRVALAQHLEGETGEDADVAATRVWAAGEALKKLGLPVDAPLTFVSAAPDGWVLLAAGGQRVGVLVTRVRGREARLALAVALPAAAAADGRLRAS